MKEIMGLGIRFFVIQIAGILLFSTGNIIISQLLGPEKVVPYNLSYQYFGISNMAFSIILAPYWSSVTEAYTKGDNKWIKSSMKKLSYFSFLFLVLIIAMLFFAPLFYKLWVGDKVEIELSTNLWMALFFAFTIFYSPYTYFINGTGKVKLQMISLVFTALLNIPLAILLVSKFNMGVSGVIASTVISLIPHVILSPIQYTKIIEGHASGIWNA
jgi:O-antigen/teichoic acid export membrane protein